MMVVVVEEQSQNGIQASAGFIGNTIDFFRSNWKFMLVGVIIIVLFFIIWYLLKKMEEERHEREEPGYQLFKTVKASCRLNADPTLIVKKWNPASLWLLIIPVIGWIIMPFVKKDHSAKLIDYSGKFIGYYRGEFKSMDNTINYLVYKTKMFIFFEDQFVIKVPLQLKIKTKKRDKHNEYVLDKATKRPILIEKNLKLGHLISKLANHDIKLYCIGLEKVGTYYYCPVFLTDEGDGVLDYRQFTEGAVIDSTYQIMLSRILNQSTQSMEKAINLNPNVKYNQASPEKTKEEQKQDEHGA